MSSIENQKLGEYFAFKKKVMDYNKRIIFCLSNEVSRKVIKRLTGDLNELINDETRYTLLTREQKNAIYLKITSSMKEMDVASEMMGEEKVYMREFGVVDREEISSEIKVFIKNMPREELSKEENILIGLKRLYKKQNGKNRTKKELKAAYDIIDGVAYIYLMGYMNEVGCKE